MKPRTSNILTPDVSFDGGDLDCGNGLLLLIRKHIDPLPRGGLLEIRLDRDLGRGGPARLVPPDRQRAGVGGHDDGQAAQLSWSARARWPSARAPRSRRASQPARPPRRRPSSRRASASALPAARAGAGDPAAGRDGHRQLAAAALDAAGGARAPRRPAVGGGVPGDRRRRRAAGAWTRSCAPASTWSPTASSGATATPASSAAGSTTASSSRSPTCCRWSTIPSSFEEELRALDVPAGDVRHPAVFGPLGPQPPARACTSSSSSRTLTDKPVKVALPGPVSADAHDVDGVHLRPRLRLARAPRGGHRAGAARGAAPTCSPPAWRWCSSTSRCSPRSCSPAPRRTRSFMCGALSREGRCRRPSWPSRATCSTRWSAGLPRERVGAARLPRQLDARRIGRR